MHNDLEYNWLAYYVVLTSIAEELHATENVRCLKENWFNIAVYVEKNTFILNFNIENYWFGQI